MRGRVNLPSLRGCVRSFRILLRGHRVLLSSATRRESHVCGISARFLPLRVSMWSTATRDKGLQQKRAVDHRAKTV